MEVIWAQGKRWRKLAWKEIGRLDPRLYTGWRQYACLAGIGLILGTITAPVVGFLIEQQRYALAADAQKLVGQANPNLAAKFTYDQKAAQYVFNQSGKRTGDSSPAEALRAQTGGNGKADDTLYSANLPTDLSRGLSVYDNNLEVSFTMTPLFTGDPGKLKAGRLVYPLDYGQAVYTAKSNGIKEDIVLDRSPGAALSLSYKLNLPDSLQARMLPDGSLGIYSADPTLFGNISYGSEADQAKVMQARKNGHKNHLVFGLPAPTIIQSGGQPNRAKAAFTLNGDILTVTARGLDKLSYPATIDPSVTINSSSGFMTGNNESSINFPANQITRSPITGGSVGGGWSNTASVNNARYNEQVVAYNGYLYMTGGQTTSGTGTDLADVQFALINTANGTLGAWHYTHNSIDDGTTFVAGFSTAVSAHGSFAYNGYLYVVDGSNNSGNPISTVQYAPINSNGTVGAWNTTSSTLRTGEVQTFAYRGYAYALGSAEEFAPINTDGTLGAWHYTHNSIDDGTTYVSGGATTAVLVGNFIYNIASASTTVTYAPLNGDGTVGTFVSTASYPSTQAQFSATACGGYIYLLSSTVHYYAPILAAGGLGSWLSTAPLQTSKNNSDEICSAGYLYDVAGYTGSQIPSTNVQYAKIDSAGVTGAVNTTTVIPSVSSEQGTNTGRTYNGVAAYNGYLYVVGGTGKNALGTATALASVEFAPINSDGSLGSWTNSTALPNARTGVSAVAYNGILYAIGGKQNGAGIASTEVDIATLNASTGAVGSWSTTSALGSPTEFAAVALYNSTIYLFGGDNGSGSFSASVQYATISSGNVLSAWSTTTSFQTPRAGLGAGIWGNYVYVYGGGDNSSLYNDVQFAPLNANGTVGTWHYTHNSTDDGTTFSAGFTTVRENFSYGLYNGNLYVIGGDAPGVSGPLNDIQFAQLNANGTVGAWNTAPFTLPSNIYGQGSALYTNHILTAGGFDGTTYYQTVSYTAINNGGTGDSTNSVAVTTSSFTAGRYSHASAAYNGYLYIMGGIHGAADTLCNTTADVHCSDVQYAPLNPDGTVGAWHFTHDSNDDGTTFVSGFHTARGALAAVAYAGYLYILGGVQASSNTACSTVSGTYCQDVQFAKLNPNGTVGAWHYTHNSTDDGGSFVSGFMNSRGAPGVAVYKGYLYLGGGNNGATYYNDVQFAPINSDGTIGAWHYTHSSTDDGTTFVSGFTTARSSMGFVAYNGFLYVAGGDSNAGANMYNDVQYAPLNANGTVGTWLQTNSFSKARRNMTVIPYEGYLYIMNGCQAGTSTTCSVSLNDSEFAAISSNGAVGQWRALLAATSNPITLTAAVPAAGRLYITGGVDSGGTLSSTTYYHNLDVLPRTGSYSKFIDLGSGGNILSSITYNGFLAEGAADISYRTAASTTLGSVNPSNYINVCASGIRYVWLSVTLDDSAVGAVFPDAAGGIPANLTSVTVNYSAALTHPAPAQRLRGGKYFSSNVQQPLDLCTP